MSSATGARSVPSPVTAAADDSIHLLRSRPLTEAMLSGMRAELSVEGGEQVAEMLGEHVLSTHLGVVGDDGRSVGTDRHDRHRLRQVVLLRFRPAVFAEGL